MRFTKLVCLAVSVCGGLALAHPVFGQTQTPPAEKTTRQERKSEKRERINKLVKQEEEGNVIFAKQYTIGGKLYSDGWGAFYEHGKAKSTNWINLWNIEFGERKHIKENKSNINSGSGLFFERPVIYGKANNFYFLKLGMGQSYLIGGKGNKNGVAISAAYSGGLSLGLLKPYYIQVREPRNSEILEIKWMDDNSRNDSLFLDPTAIQGSSSLFTGANETQIKPGLFLRGALRFDYGKYNEVISAVDAGFNVEYYFGDATQMALIEPKKSFVNVYVALHFGRRK
jgi:hypothetical protein